MKALQRRFRRSRAYTLIELTLAMSVGMGLALMMLAIFNQQLAFLKIFNVQSFLTTDGPALNNYLSRVLGSAEGFQLYETPEGFEDNVEPSETEASVLVLKFKEPGGSFRYSMLSFEDPDGEKPQGLYFRHVSPTTLALGEAEWALSTRAADVEFSIDAGILKVKITGPNGEEITYGGTQQL